MQARRLSMIEAATNVVAGFLLALLLQLLRLAPPISGVSDRHCRVREPISELFVNAHGPHSWCRGSERSTASGQAARRSPIWARVAAGKRTLSAPTSIVEKRAKSKLQASQPIVHRKAT
jgi:hypothetical protein